MRIHRRKQRGVVLLVVVSMLVLFVLIGVTYAIVSSQYRRGARIVSRTKQLGVDPEQQLDSALYQVLRDTRGTSSRIRGHSLLRDMYGSSRPGKLITDPKHLANGQFLSFQATPADPKTTWSTQLNEYAGCVLTFTSGVLKGTSTRIIRSQNTTFRVMRPKNNSLPKATDYFIINGAPFNGTNRNESYDAVDPQNMALAAVIPQPPPPSVTPARVIPSFHRPALVRYWQAQGGWGPALQRQTILRPMIADHPNFTGSNAAPLLTTNPLKWAMTGKWDDNPNSPDNAWDVDNDNDGTLDSIWTDLGMPVQTDASGRKYKPLFAVLCVDMDGKLNLNAHGNLSHVQTKHQQEVRLAGKIVSRYVQPGQGFGPSEISFQGVCKNRSFYQDLLINRYGSDRSPGKQGPDFLTQAKLSQYFFPPHVPLNKLARAGFDQYGQKIALGVDPYGQPVFETLKVLDDTPYEINLSQPHQRGPSNIATDTPYSVAELERVLRSHDADQQSLPGGISSSNRLHRLLNPLTGQPIIYPLPGYQSNQVVTTDSYDLPVANGTDLAAIRKHLLALEISLPPELQMGIRWNINQPFGEKSPRNIQRRKAYTKSLYTLITAMARYNGIDDTGQVMWKPHNVTTAQQLAQWTANAVDFRDADSIMTPFQYDPNPLDGWKLDPASPIVWGCERPELLITETLAFHDRRTEDLDTDPSKKKTDDTDNPDEDFDQRLRPRGSLFIELYNPWTGSSPRPPELYGNSSGVVLHAAIKGSPTWRMLIVKGNLKGTDPDSWKLADTNNNVERSIYFTKPGKAALPGDVDGQPYQPKDPPEGKELSMSPLQPGRYAVVGSSGRYQKETDSYITTIGRHMDATEDDFKYDTTRRIHMDPNLNRNQFQVRNNSGVSPLATRAQPVVAIPINSLNISEPTDNYPAFTDDEATQAGGEGAYSKVRDIPLDDERVDGERPGKGNNPNFRHIYLQRLANPLKPWNQQTNPYRTIDSMRVNLEVFNGVSKTSEPGVPLPKLQTIERGVQKKDSLHYRSLWRSDYDKAKAATTTQEDTHVVPTDLGDSLGALNTTYGLSFTVNNLPPAPPGKLNNYYLGAPAPHPTRLLDQDRNPHITFSTLSWNNRSFISPHELMLVPATSQFRLTRDFGRQPGTPYGLNGEFGHLLNFFNPAGGLYRIFDLLQTPSLFARTESIFHPEYFIGTNKRDASDLVLYPPNNQISSFRNPGKINLNTIFDKRVWDGLWNNDLNNKLTVLNNSDPPVAESRKFTGSPVPWDRFVASRRGYVSSSNVIVTPDVANKARSYFSNPFRAVSSSGTGSTESTVLRSDGGSNKLPFFPGLRSNVKNVVVQDYYAQQRWQPNARYQSLQRLSNLTTTRSNVYAIWITVGYFEVDRVANDPTIYPNWNNPQVYPDGYAVGAELGWDRGEIRRHRGFYMVDRSIPVAFEPGENHNVDRAILLRRFIE